jgi:hypothetical protein
LALVPKTPVFLISGFEDHRGIRFLLDAPKPQTFPKHPEIAPNIPFPWRFPPKGGATQISIGWLQL